MKIDKNTRIKFPMEKIRIIREKYGTEFVDYYTFKKAFENDSGLKLTSSRFSRASRKTFLYFKIIDIKKYLFAKIKHGF